MERGLHTWWAVVADGVGDGLRGVLVDVLEARAGEGDAANVGGILP